MSANLHLVGGRDGGFRVRYVNVTPTGRRTIKKCSVRDLQRVEFEGMDPVRKFKGHKNDKHFPNWWWCTFTGRLVECESWLERDCAMLIDYRANAVGLIGQPFVLSWAEPAKRSGFEEHTPDFMVVYDDGSVKVVDCKSSSAMNKPDTLHKFAKTKDACTSIGWSYEVLHEVDPVLLLNMQWLSGYRRPLHPRLRDLVPKVIDVCSTPVTISDAERAAVTNTDRVLWRPVLFHLMWHHVIEPTVPLQERALSEQTVVAVVEEAKGVA